MGKRIEARFESLVERGMRSRDFEWQGGYADFSVSESNVEKVKRYIAQQEQHHSHVNFQDELRELLQRHRLAWDEGYLWD